MTPHKLASTLLLLVLTLPGCGHVNRFRDREARVRTIDEVGSVRVSVVSVAEWSEYVDSLLPGFKLTGDQALEKVVPNARVLDERRLRASRTELQAGFPTLAPGANPGDRPVEVPATTEGLDTSGSAAGARTAEGLGSIGALDKTDLGRVDPMLQYGAADALKQEVELLNRTVRDAAQRDGYVPYVVRMKVGLMTRRRNLPYDVYANLSFFSAEIVDSMKSGLPTEKVNTPRVVPLLVTDSLEAGLHSAALGRLIEGALALQGTTGTVAFGLDQSVTIDDLVRALGRNLNSLFMVSRLSDNTVRLRMGAHLQVSQNYAAIPRNHTLTLLVLLPEAQAVAGKPVLIQARTEMVHVRTGKALEEKRHRTEKADIERIAARFELCQFGESPRSATCRRTKSDRLDEAYFAVVENDWGAFYSSMEPLLTDKTDLIQIWSELANLTPGYYEDEITFEVPASGTDSFPATQMVALLDDTKTVTQVRVVGGQGIRASRLCSALHFFDGTHSKALPPEKVEVDGRGETVMLTFRSLEALGLAGYAKEAGKQIQLQLSYAPDRATCWSDATSWGATNAKRMASVYHAAKPEAPSAGFALAWQPDHVVSKNGEGTLVFELEGAKTLAEALKLILEISKASVLSVQIDAGAATPSGQTFELPISAGKKTRVRVQLGNLVVGRGVGVEITNPEKVKLGSHTVEVRGS